MRPDGRYEIAKTKLGDFSTFIHEPAHAYLEMFRRLTQREGASDALQSDFKKITDWLGTTPEDVYKNGFTTAEHEQWAKATEQYAREGKAPAPGLRRAFDAFSVWLHSIYRRASALGVELSPEIRGVMDRMYAGEDALGRAARDKSEPLFNSPEEAGWTEAEYRNYAALHDETVDQARAQVRGELNDAALRDKTQRWREEQANVREAVTAELDARPEYRAIRALRRGSLDSGVPLTLNRDELARQFGEARVTALQKLHRGLYRNEGGTDAETAAELLGFHSGEEMMRALENTPRRPGAIEAATRANMTARHGDIRYDGSMDSTARLALENDARTRATYSELKALRAKVDLLQKRATDAKAAMAGIQIAPLEHYREAAKGMTGQKSMTDLQPWRYLQATEKFSRESFDAVRKGDAVQAEAAKNKELLNRFLYREAMAEQDFTEKFDSYRKRVQSRGIQQRLGLAGSDYREQFNWIMGRYRMGPEPAAPARSLRAWAEDMDGQGKEPAIAPGILNEGRFADYRNVPLSELHDVHDALVNVRHLALKELETVREGRKMQFEQMANELAEGIRANRPSKPETVFEKKTALTAVRDLVRSVDVQNSRMEFYIDKWDGGQRGPWRKYVWEPYENAKGDEYAMQNDWTKRMNDQVETEAKRQGLRLLDKVLVDGISPESSGPMTRKELVSMALNMGNGSNMDRLEKTFDFHGWDREAIQKAGGMLTSDEWNFVQRIWDSLKPWGERMNAFEKEQTGLPPVMVQVQPFKVVSSDGVEMDLDGGYFPVKYDPRHVLKGYEEESTKLARNLMEKGYGRATTSRNYTKERTGSAGPLLLDYERVLSEHIAKVTKDLSHRKFMQDSNVLLNHPVVRKAVRETEGSMVEGEMMPWLRAGVNDRNGSADGGANDMRYLEKLRSNQVKASLAFKLSTDLLQFTHLSRLMTFTKPGSYTGSMVDFWKNPVQMTAAIRQLSPNEMRFRGEHIDRDYASTLRQAAGKKDLSAAALRFGYAAFKYIDHAVSFPLWHSVYNDALLKNGPEMDAEGSRTIAMHAADAAVRMGLGTSAKGDLPPFMRSEDMAKKIESTLGGFHNLNYNIVRHKVAGEASRGFQAGNYAAATAKLSMGLAMTLFIPAIMSGYASGNGPKDGENWGLWAAKRSLFFAGGTIFWVKDLFSLLEYGTLNPMVGFATRAAKNIKNIAEGAGGKAEDWTELGIDALENLGDTFGVAGTGQAAHTARYIHRANEGKIENPSVFGAVVAGH